MAAFATLHYYADNSTHALPARKKSWCSYNRGRATNQNTRKPIQNTLSKEVVEVGKLSLECLGRVQFLSFVIGCRNQNVNESFHYVVWQIARKDMFASAIGTKCEFCLPVPLFNNEYKKSLKKFCPLAGIKFNLSMTNQ